MRRPTVFPPQGDHAYAARTTTRVPLGFETGIALAFLAACAACTQSAGPAAQTQTAQNAPVNVVTAAATLEPMGIEIEAVGTTRANESVQVTSKASNVVTAIRFREGEEVAAGTVLVEMDDAEAQAALAEAEAALADTRNQYNRTRDLVERQVLSVAQLDQIDAALKGNQARVAAARARLADTVIRAAFAGRTGFRDISVGSFVSPGSPITTLDDISLIKLDFTVPETYLFLIRRGLPIMAASAGLPGRVFQGEVTNVDSRVDPVTRSVTVRAEIPNPDGTLRQGMFMTVSLKGDVVPTLLVPEGAIVPEQGRTYVFVVRANRIERREVRTGKRRPGDVEVVSGLEANERVVVEGTQNVRDGTVVSDVAPGGLT